MSQENLGEIIGRIRVGRDVIEFADTTNLAQEIGAADPANAIDAVGAVAKAMALLKSHITNAKTANGWVGNSFGQALTLFREATVGTESADAYDMVRGATALNDGVIENKERLSAALEAAGRIEGYLAHIEQELHDLAGNRTYLLEKTKDTAASQSLTVRQATEYLRSLGGNA